MKFWEETTTKEIPDSKDKEMPEDPAPTTPIYKEEVVPVTIIETVEIPTTEFDSENFVNCNSLIGSIIVDLFYVGDCQ